MSNSPNDDTRNRPARRRSTPRSTPVDARIRTAALDPQTIIHLADYYEPESIPKWLQGRNPELGGRRPIDAIRAGEFTEVLSTIAAQTNGAFF